MKHLFLVLSSILLSTHSFAASATLTCATPEKDIRYSAGNGSNTIEIDYADAKTQQKGTYTVPVYATPDYGYNSTGGDDFIMTVPLSEKSFGLKSCTREHIIHADGTECFGREFWDIRYTQRFVLSAKDGNTLNRPGVLLGRNVPGKISDGYIVRDFQCTDEGYTTAGGCFSDMNDKLYETVEMDCP